MSFWKTDLPQAEKNFSVAIVTAEFNADFVEKLLDNTINNLEKCGIKNIEIFLVPGSFEIPVTVKKISENNNFDSIITLGVILRGETIHFDLISKNCAERISKIATSKNIPIIFGVLSVENENQAKERIARGKEFASAAVKMMNLFSQFSE